MVFTYNNEAKSRRIAQKLVQVENMAKKKLDEDEVDYASPSAIENNRSNEHRENEFKVNELLSEPQDVCRRCKPAGLVDDMPVMKLFVRHMTSIDGKKRTQASATDHMRRVGYVLCQLKKKPDDIRLLWNDSALNFIPGTVFERNHLLRRLQIVKSWRESLKAM